MQYKWSDIIDIAIDLHDAYPEIDPQWISFPDLHSKIFCCVNQENLSTEDQFPDRHHANLLRYQ